jgi:hypothetical protein
LFYVAGWEIFVLDLLLDIVKPLECLCADHLAVYELGVECLCADHLAVYELAVVGIAG